MALRLVEQLKGRTDQTGQFMLPVGETREDADALFEEAQAAEEAGDVESAQRLYRKVMRTDPRDPAAAFNLGNLLRSTGRKVEAEAAYREGLAVAPHHEELKLGLVNAYYQQQKNSAALVIIEDLLQKPDTPAAAFVWHAKLLIRAGETLTLTGRISDIYEKSGSSGIMDFVVLETEATDAEGKRIFFSRNTLISRRM